MVRLTARVTGQLAVGVVSALVVAGLGSVVVRVRTAGLEPFPSNPGAIAEQLTRVSDAAPPLTLTDQFGREIALESYRGRPVLVAFAFALCQTVCPLVVADVMAARRQLGDDPPRLLIVTLDPWRDTPTRLASIAKQWGLDEDAHVLSGPPEEVERTLNGWRVPRARNQNTGDISHPSIVYVIGADGRIAYVVSANPDVIAAAVRAL
jgi:protein SCO1/2